MKNKIYQTLKVFAGFFFFAGILFCGSAFSQKKSSSFKAKQYAAETNEVKKFETDETEIFRLINQARVGNNLNSLDWDEQLAEMAREYSEKMARENFFSHFDLEGGNAAKRAKKSRLKNWSKIGENLFSVERIPRYAAFAVKGWMKSPTHKLVILDKDWTTTGIGISEAENGEIYITQLFIQR